MHNILIAVNNQQQSNKYKKILSSHGYQVIATVKDVYSALRVLQNRREVLSLVHVDLQGFGGFHLAEIIAQEGLGPVVLISKHALERGENLPKSLFGVLIQPITEYQLLNTLNLALAQYKHQKELEKKVTELKNTIEGRKIIEKAKGILMKKQKLSEEEAYKLLRNKSMEKRITMKELAETLIKLDDFHDFEF